MVVVFTQIGQLRDPGAGLRPPTAFRAVLLEPTHGKYLFVSGSRELFVFELGPASVGAGEPLCRIFGAEEGILEPGGLAFDTVNHRLAVIDISCRAVRFVLARSLSHQARISGAWDFAMGPSIGPHARGSQCALFRQPRAVAIPPNSSNVFVFDSEQEKVFIFNEAGAPLASFGTWSPWQSLCGYPCRPSPSCRQPQQQSQQDPRLHCPAAMVADQRDTVFICDTARHRVVALSFCGTRRQTFGSYGWRLGQFVHPSGIALHPRTGELFVSDATLRVQLFTRTGEPLQSFGLPFVGSGTAMAPTTSVAIHPLDESTFVAQDDRIDVWQAVRKPQCLSLVQRAWQVALIHRLDTTVLPSSIRLFCRQWADRSLCSDRLDHLAGLMGDVEDLEIALNLVDLPPTEEPPPLPESELVYRNNPHLEMVDMRDESWPPPRAYSLKQGAPPSVA